MIIRLAEPGEYKDVLEYYKACNYGGGLDERDMVVIAVDEHIAGAVRICIENGIKVLRGMQIKPAFQRKGIGAAILKFMAANIEMHACYCLPYKHLLSFYSKIGFEEISLKDAPRFLAERLEKYQSNGNREITIMRIKE
ncbi:MAG TPA: GNAT family N-acetyltransferase [Mucilaginibacter sp.]|jgi:GNAT superfamily N-acetyltransferase|nr:GNAT family N-acetyltransferase [Mucilaginibacter sp.]